MGALIWEDGRVDLAHGLHDDRDLEIWVGLLVAILAWIMASMV